ncbi:GntR family transcriptional regulator [Janibacter hoylei PVAS-1]|uniref:GntR family transcriptional regulator n=1 Tax=Janibacter hoylei PVAS-1 TaxID=1210046 RepID=K1DY44_9MICO|nr:GntR family transcriptional regulator [Janibacter hoylei PVAS-1]
MTQDWLAALEAERGSMGRASASEKVADALRTRIIEGDLPPGTRLSEERIGGRARRLPQHPARGLPPARARASRRPRVQPRRLRPHARGRRRARPVRLPADPRDGGGAPARRDRRRPVRRPGGRRRRETRRRGRRLAWPRLGQHALPPGADPPGRQPPPRRRNATGARGDAPRLQHDGRPAHLPRALPRAQHGDRRPPRGRAPRCGGAGPGRVPRPGRGPAAQRAEGLGLIQLVSWRWPPLRARRDCGRRGNHHRRPPRRANPAARRS